MIADGVPDLGAMLGEVMRDPEKMAQLRAIMTSLGAAPQAEDAPQASDPPGSSSPEGEQSPPEEAPPPSLSPDALGGLLSSPALLAHLPALLSAFGGKDAAPAGKAANHRPDHRTALLLALKPYLNDGRQQMIDYIVNISRLGDQLGR